MLKLTGTMVASLMAASGAYASDTEYYSGQAYCDGEFRQTYLISREGSDFSVYQEGSMSRFRVMNFPEPIGVKLFDAGRNNPKVSIHEISEGKIDISIEGTSCEGVFEIKQQPGMVEAYEDVQRLSEYGDKTPATAIEISDMLSNLAPSGLLPNLDKNTLPDRTFSLANAYFQEYMKVQSEYIASQKIETQEEANEVMAFVAHAYPKNLGFNGNIYSERALSKEYSKQMETIAFRVASKGFQVKPMTDLDEVRFCQLVDSILFNRSENIEVIYGMPFSYWSREFTEAAIKRIEECNGKWSAKRAEGIAKLYPNIVRATEQMAAKLEAGRAEAALLQKIEGMMAEVQSLPNTADIYFSTRGYADLQDVELPSRASRELRDAAGQLRTVVRERQTSAMPIVAQYIEERLDFTKDEYMADDWQVQASHDDPRCTMPEIPSDADYTLKGVHRDACSRAISAASKKRAQAKCEVAKSESGLSREELETVLLINTGGNSLFDLPDMKLGEFFCRYHERSKITWEERGFFSKSYELTAQLLSDKELSTTVTFKAGDSEKGLTPERVEHSVGGNLSKLALQDRMLCLAAPDKSWCAQK